MTKPSDQRPATSRALLRMALLLSLVPTSLSGAEAESGVAASVRRPLHPVLIRNEHGCSDPGLIVDPQTGEIFCFAVWMNGKPGKHQWNDDGSEPGFEIGKTAQFMMVRSKDDGLTWSKPENLTRKLKQESWWLLAPSPQQGIALADGTLVMPVQGRTGRDRPESFSTLMLSRDHGANWTVAKPGYSGGSECQAAQLGDGSIMLNIRNHHERFRAVVVTSDLGQTWKAHPTSRNSLIEPNCNASLRRIDYEENGTRKHVLLFANPHSQKGRTHHTLQVSFDDGLTWPESHRRLLDEGRGAGYPSITQIDTKHVGIVYEGSQSHLVFQKFAIAELIRPAAEMPKEAGAKTTSHPPPGRPASSSEVQREAEQSVLTSSRHHLRIDGPREWSDFPEAPESDRLELKFPARKIATEATLLLRQQDVKQLWRIRLNGKELGRLVVDENDMVIGFAHQPSVPFDRRCVHAQLRPRQEEPFALSHVGGRHAAMTPMPDAHPLLLAKYLGRLERLHRPADRLRAAIEVQGRDEPVQLVVTAQEPAADRQTLPVHVQDEVPQSRLHVERFGRDRVSPWVRERVRLSVGLRDDVDLEGVAARRDPHCGSDRLERVADLACHDNSFALPAPGCLDLPLEWTHRELNPDLRHATAVSSRWTMSPSPSFVEWTGWESNPPHRSCEDQSPPRNMPAHRLQRSTRELNPVFRRTKAACHRNTCRPSVLSNNDPGWNRTIGLLDVGQASSPLDHGISRK